MKKETLVIDCSVSGISGDMLVGGLIDLGADHKRVREAMVSTSEFSPSRATIDIQISKARRLGLVGTRVEVNCEGEHLGIAGKDLILGMKKCVKNLRLGKLYEAFAIAATQRIIKAEAILHGSTADRVHLHEAGSLDTMADIVGVAVALEDLSILTNCEIITTTIAVGGGKVKFSHGVNPSPSPATVEILKGSGLTITGGPTDSELATPTGVAMLTQLASNSIEFYPTMEITGQGYGAGRKDFSTFPNLLRLVRGLGTKSTDVDTIYLLETNVDDVPGEIIGAAMERLFEHGAKDVSVIPAYMKKNRPGNIIRVVCEKNKVDDLSTILIRDVGSFGVRVQICDRHIVPRYIKQISVDIGRSKARVKVKIALDPWGRVLRIKPEYEDMMKISREYNISLDEISKKTIAIASKMVNTKDIKNMST
ncbi:MAG: nickel pincer cofactor biosynthesis protein LarC [Thaumarchaeota archaeon]|nr:nickel pincer cofactor biosynthesis protein LarC [Nitrososphaerota archaeon]